MDAMRPRLFNHGGTILRHTLPLALALSGIFLAAAFWAPTTAFAQGRCIRAYATPACNTDPVKPLFERTGWRTTALDHITFRVAEPQKEAAFYAALMGWTVRSDDSRQVVMDVGDWGTVIFRRAPPESFAAPAAGGAVAGIPVRAVVESFDFDIEPWNAKTVEAELRKRGLNPIADNDGKGFESFHVKDPDGFDLQLSNGQGYTKSRRVRTNAKLSTAAPFESTGWQTVWLDHLSFGVTNYKGSASFYANLLGWQPTYDEGSQNELMMADIGDIIIRGGNPLAPDFGKSGTPQGGVLDHISYGIAPWDTDRVKAELEKRGLAAQIDTSDDAEIHIAQYKSYHTTTPNGYNLQISYITHDTRLNLPIAVNPRRTGIR